MVLRPETKDVLDACARAIANLDTGVGVDLSPLRAELASQPVSEEVVDYLVRRVDEWGHGLVCVRQTERSHFANAPQEGLFMARVHPPMPTGMLKSPPVGAVLVVLNGGADGLTIEAERVWPDLPHAAR